MPNETELLRNFIDSSDAFIYLKDGEGRFLMVNDHSAALAGTTKEEMIGKTDYDFFSKEDSDMFREKDLKVTEAGKPMTFKLKVSTDGGEITVIDHKFPISVEGHPNAIGGIAIDITNIEE